MWGDFRSLWEVRPPQRAFFPPRITQDALPEELRPYDHGKLHLYRVGYQTVGQPYFWLRPITHVDFPLDETRSITDLQAAHRYRTGYQTVGQPLFWLRSTTHVDLPTDDTRSITNLNALHIYRVGYQTVGQPWMALRLPQATRLDIEEIRPNASLWYWTTGPAVVVSTKHFEINLGLSFSRLGGHVY